MTTSPTMKRSATQYKSLSFDPENKYTVPYTWGTLGIIYNSTMVDERHRQLGRHVRREVRRQRPDDPQLPGRSGRRPAGPGLLTSTPPTRLRSGRPTSCWPDAKSKGVYQAFVMDEVFGKMEGSNAAIAMYYAGDYLTMLDNNPDLKFVVPKEGSNWFVDAMCVLKDRPAQGGGRGVDQLHRLYGIQPGQHGLHLATPPPIWRHWRVIPLTTRRPTASLWTRSAMRSWPLPMTCWPAASCIPTSPPTR